MCRTISRACCVLLLVASGWLAGFPAAKANPKLYTRAIDSVAFIISPRGNDMVSLGSGSLVNARQHIVLTNYHVVADQDLAVVFFPSYRGRALITEPAYYIENTSKLGIAGRVVARSKERDLALIKLKSLPEGARELPLSPRSPQPAETLHAFGNSGLKLGSLWRYSKGEVRQIYVRRFTTGEPSFQFEVSARIVETQIPVNQGDSGGPVLNDAGELAAVTQGYPDSPTQRLVSTMIDVSEVRSLLKKEKLLPFKKSGVQLESP
jgi:S1-C subfamily serine protease